MTDNLSGLIDRIYTPDELLDMVFAQEWKTYGSNYDAWLRTHEPELRRLDVQNLGKMESE